MSYSRRSLIKMYVVIHFASKNFFQQKKQQTDHSRLLLAFVEVGSGGFEPPKSKDSGFTVRPIWPLWKLPQ